MKKLISFAAAVTMLCTTSVMNIFAEDGKAEPVNIEEKVYEQLLKQYQSDKNNDGVLDDEEFHALDYVQLNLEGVQDISWLAELKDLTWIVLKGGDITDLSFMADMEGVNFLSLENMPLTDISFVKKMQPKRMYLLNMEQITTEQRLDVMTWIDDVTLEEGFGCKVGAVPSGLFYDDEAKISIEGEAAVDISGGYDTACDIYGFKAGESTYSVTIGGKEVYSGKIHITENVPEKYPLSDNDGIKYFDSVYYGYSQTYGEHSGILHNKALFAERGGYFFKALDNVDIAQYVYDSVSDGYISGDAVVLTDGTLLLNDKKVDHQGGRITDIRKNCFITEDNELYILGGTKDSLCTVKVADDFKSFLEFSEYSSGYYENTNGELVCINGGEPYYTGIMNVKSSHNDYFVDGDGILWEVDTRNGKQTKKKLKTGVEFVGYRYYDNGTTCWCVYITTEGDAYTVSGNRKVVLYDKPEYFKDTGYFRLKEEFQGGDLIADRKHYFITNDNVLTLDLMDQKASIDNAKNVLFCYNNEDAGEVIVYFTRQDDTLWQYNTLDKKFSPVDFSVYDEMLTGDLNMDGKLDGDDLIELNDYLLGRKFSVTGVADVNGDGKVNTYDLVYLRRLIADQ